MQLFQKNMTGWQNSGQCFDFLQICCIFLGITTDTFRHIKQNDVCIFIHILKVGFLRVLCLVWILSGFLKAQEGFRVFPYLQNPAPDAITILWFSEEDSSGWLSYQKQDSELKFIINSDPSPAEALAYPLWEDTTFFEGQAPPAPFRHRIRIENLEPASHYDYTVMQGPDSFRSSFRTAPGKNTPLRFIAYSDSETEPESTGKYTSWDDPASDSVRTYFIDQTAGYRNNLEVIKSRQPNLLFISGDLVESGGEQRDWDEFWRHNARQNQRTKRCRRNSDHGCNWKP